MRVRGRCRLNAVLGTLLLATAGPASAAPETAGVEARAPDLVLRGTMTRADHRRHRELHFDVPDGVERLAIDLAYEPGPGWAAIDMALFGPHGFRGGGGFFKKQAVLTASDATPGYLPGPLTPGRWTLVLGGANVAPGARLDFTVKVRFTRLGTADSGAGFAPGSLRPGPAWFRGDLHAHTGHSDGACKTLKGTRAPCPVYRTLEAARARGLDFVAVTDHNTTAHFAALRELQPHFDDLLILPGREITTYQGHANVIGPLGFIDFRLGGPTLPDFDAFADAVEAVDGLISINHPGIPEKGGCAGCGWSAPVSDFGRVQAVEVVNGVVARYAGGIEGASSAIPFWHARLNEGARLTAVGGSDNHDPDLAPAELSAIGTPTTVVHAASLSTRAILDGVRAGRVFIDVEGSADRLIDVSAVADKETTVMGGALSAPVGSMVRFVVRVVGAPGATVEVIENGGAVRVFVDPIVRGHDDVKTFERRGDGVREWVSVNVRAPDGRLILIGNPIHLNPSSGPAVARP